MKRPELLVPAGNLEKMRTALLYGADAVYVGVSGLSLRSESAEMTIEELASGIHEAHLNHVKVYAALNTFARNIDLDRVRNILPQLLESQVDALIVSDPGLIRLIRASAPHIPLHLSTQSNTTNIEAVCFWRDQGVKRIILARELSLAEVGDIVASVPEMEIEIFVHGAMCMAYSGRCYLSAWRNRRSANEGDCTHPCRWEYILHESTRPHDPLVLEEDERFTYLLSSKDLCLIEHLPEVAACGVTSLKIEGRMKSSYYVAVVTRTYRQAIDALLSSGKDYRLDPSWKEELQKVSHRGYTTGFAFTSEKITETSPLDKQIQHYEPAGIVLSHDDRLMLMRIEVRNPFTSGDELELLLPKDTRKVDTAHMMDPNGAPLQRVHAGMHVHLPSPCPVPRGAILRKKSGAFHA